MRNKNIFKNVVSWVVFVIFCSICLYDIVIIENGHFDRMEMMTFRMVEGILFGVSVFFTIMQINFYKYREAVLILVLLIFIALLFIGSLAWETQSTKDLEFQEPDKVWEILHILMSISFVILKLYISINNIIKNNRKI